MSVLFPFCAQNGDGFVDEAKLQTIVNLLNEVFNKIVAGKYWARGDVWAVRWEGWKLD